MTSCRCVRGVKHLWTRCRRNFSVDDTNSAPSLHRVVDYFTVTAPHGVFYSHGKFVILQVSPGEAPGEIRKSEAVRFPVPQVWTAGGSAERILLRQLPHQRGSSRISHSEVSMLDAKCGINLYDSFYKS